MKGPRVSDNLRRYARILLSRDVVRTIFLVFFAGLMVQLWLFARWALGAGPYVARPDAVVGIIPVGAFMSFFAWLRSGSWDTVLPAGLVIIIAAIVLSVALKRGFCGWICPVGAFFQLPANLGRTLRKGRDLRVPRPLDLTLRGIRYAITAALVFMLFTLPVEVAENFRTLPYYSVADIKIVEYFVHPPIWWIAAGLAVVGASMLWGNVWCRWICPLGGLYGVFGLASVSNVVRDDDTCIACGKCAKVCPNRVPVDRLAVVRAPECDGCQTCTGACPEPGALTPRLITRFVMPWWVWPVAAVAIWLGIYAVAVATGNWRAGVPTEQIVEAVRSIIVTP
jgi:polyferredoxin